MHAIRLKEPWLASWLEDEESEETCVVRYERKFHRPTGIEGVAVSLNIALVALDRERPTATLNDLPLTLSEGQPGRWAAPVAERLQAFNRLALLIRLTRDNRSTAIPPLSSIGEICLLIQDMAPSPNAVTDSE